MLLYPISMRFSLPLTLVLLFVPQLRGFPPAQQDTKTLAHAVDQHYDALKSLKCSFTEMYQAPGISRTESGTLWLKKPGRMRWEYREPREKLFMADSHTAYFYVLGEKQARKTPIKNLDDLRSPIRYLLGKTKLEKEFNGLSLAPDVAPLHTGDVIIRGVPKGMEDRVSEVVLEVSPAHQILRILIREVDGTTTDFQFSQIEENVPMQDSLFRFTPPPGVETIQAERVAQ